MSGQWRARGEVAQQMDRDRARGESSVCNESLKWLVRFFTSSFHISSIFQYTCWKRETICHADD